MPAPTTDATRNTALTLIAGGVLVVVVGLILAFWRPWSSTAPDADPAAGADAPARAQASTEILGPNPYLLGPEAEGDATFVEFLDFQCPACAAVKPAIDEVRAEYAGEITFAARFLPLEGHENAVPAAIAAAAADEQGEFVAMYDQLFEHQEEWSPLADPTEAYRGYAEEIGLDLERFDADSASPEIEEQVLADRQAAEDLGLDSTPSFFVDGEPFAPQSQQDLVDALDAAAGR